MVSFIIIGKNEEKNLTRCIQNIQKATEFLKLDHEIIYVDSRSSDQSVEVVGQFQQVKILQLTGECNAAIGRNAGAMTANGGVLFFVDADMKIHKAFLQEALNKEGQLKYDVVSGIVVDVVNGKETQTRFLNRNGASDKHHVDLLDGGIFLIKKTIWDTLGGMNTKYKVLEDSDLGLRLARRGYRFVRLQQIIAHHFTIPYFERSRVWKDVIQKKDLFNCVIYRDHFFSKYAWRRMRANDKTLAVLAFAVILSIIFPAYILLFAIMYLAAVFLRSLKQEKLISLLEYTAFFIVVDLSNFLGFFLFIPKKKEVKYQVLSGIEKPHKDVFTAQ